LNITGNKCSAAGDGSIAMAGESENENDKFNSLFNIK
jgi:hypothetical protein